MSLKKLGKVCKIRGKYVLYYKGHLFHTEDNIYLFSTEDAAIKSFFESLELCFSNMTEKSYIAKNQDFLRKVLVKYLDKENVKEEYNSLIEAILAPKEDKTMAYYEQMSKLGDMIRDAVQNYMKQFLEIVKLAE